MEIACRIEECGGRRVGTAELNRRRGDLFGSPPKNGENKGNIKEGATGKLNDKAR